MLAAVRGHADLCGKRGTFIYDVTACREIILVTEPDGSESSAFDPDAKEPVVPDQSTIDALNSKLGRILGMCCMFSDCFKSCTHRMAQQKGFCIKHCYNDNVSYCRRASHWGRDS